MTNEVWKDVKGFEGWYQISNLGNVRRVAPVHGKPRCNNLKPYGVWVCGDYYDAGDVCSECDWDSLISHCDYRYCPNCGSKMEGDSHD